MLLVCCDQALNVQVRKSGGGPQRLVDVSPNSELGLAIAADENSVRQTAYLNEMQYIGGKAEANNRASFHNDALEKSGMYRKATGDEPYNVDIPAVEYTIEPSGGEETGTLQPEEALTDNGDPTNKMKNETND